MIANPEERLAGLLLLQMLIQPQEGGNEEEIALKNDACRL